jgi:hypothetical protein
MKNTGFSPNLEYPDSEEERDLKSSIKRQKKKIQRQVERAARKEKEQIQEEIQKYFGRNNLSKQSFYDSIEKELLPEEKGRTRQRGIYRIYMMLGYTITNEADRARGLDDILADIRALPYVTIVTVAIKNQKVSEGNYIAGLSIKFIPSIPGKINSPEDVKARIISDIRDIKNVNRIFKVTPKVERLE